MNIFIDKNKNEISVEGNDFLLDEIKEQKYIVTLGDMLDLMSNKPKNNKYNFSTLGKVVDNEEFKVKCIQGFLDGLYKSDKNKFNLSISKYFKFLENLNSSCKISRKDFKVLENTLCEILDSLFYYLSSSPNFVFVL